MKEDKLLNYINDVIENMPSGWLATTTHRLDIYEEKLAKTQFLDQFTVLFNHNNWKTEALNELPTAYDYIRLGHPLSCVLEWVIANINMVKPENVISFSSTTMPILAILRKNALDHKKTQIIYTDKLPNCMDIGVLRNVYGYKFDVKQVTEFENDFQFNGTTIYISNANTISSFNLAPTIDFCLNLQEGLGSVLVVKGTLNESYISEIQHVRRRETIAMTPTNSLTALQAIIKKSPIVNHLKNNFEADKKIVLDAIKKITNTNIKPLVASSGLSIQYAILMGLIDDAMEKHTGKAIKIIVPPNCYGGTNDQARRVAACRDNVAIVDLLVDGDNDMVQSIEFILTQIALEDAVPLIIAEIPTNPRVEVPNLIDLKHVLSKKRKTAAGTIALDPVFILDQTFCPNVPFLGEQDILANVRTISFASGSKFPSGGKCTAGYCVGSHKTITLMEKIEAHLTLCDNEATAHQYAILAKQLPSMKQRIKAAYKNTLEFVNFIHQVLPEAKINFVSDELAKQGFTPSVFSLDLPTKGNTAEERETYKRILNHQLIHLMITKIPEESKYCVSYGQLKGCYWTIPATSTQGTTKETDKDYIVRVALSPDINLEQHKKVFLEFIKDI